MSGRLDDGSLVEAALDYAGQGYRILPCQPGGKAPLLSNWPARATDSLVAIRRWWSQWPDANIGILTGAPGADVLDIDVRPAGDGLQALAYLRSEGVLDGAFREVETPSRGIHLWFPGTTQRKSKISGAFVDFQAAGGYVLAPPSEVMSGGNVRRYREVWSREGGVALDFSKVTEMLATQDESGLNPTTSTAEGHHGRVPGGNHPAVRKLRRATVGERNTMLFNSACWLLREGYSTSRLAAVALDLGLCEEEVRTTLASAHRVVRCDV